MNLDKIQEMWERDAVIDPDNLHDESLKIPQLHAKYYTVYNTITLLREKARESYSKIKLERHNYYTGVILYIIYGGTSESNPVQYPYYGITLQAIFNNVYTSSYDSAERVFLGVPPTPQGFSLMMSLLQGFTYTCNGC